MTPDFLKKKERSDSSNDGDTRRREERALYRPVQGTGVPVERFLAGIAHELRNPAEGLSNALYLLRQAGIKTETAKLLDIAESELNRITQIVQALLDNYKGHSAEAVMVSLSEVLESTLSFYAQKIVSKKTKIERRYSSHGGIEALPGQMRQVFTNVIINALEALPPEAGRLILKVSDCCDCKHRKPGIRVTIADTGAGISPDHLKRIFSGTFTTKGDKGTGVGLWIVKRIVNTHNGSIRVRSSVRPGKSGTCFSIFLPISYRPESDQRQTAASEEPDNGPRAL